MSLRICPRHGERCLMKNIYGVDVEDASMASQRVLTSNGAPLGARDRPGRRTIQARRRGGSEAACHAQPVHLQDWRRYPQLRIPESGPCERRMSGQAAVHRSSSQRLSLPPCMVSVGAFHTHLDDRGVADALRNDSVYDILEARNVCGIGIRGEAMSTLLRSVALPTLLSGNILKDESEQGDGRAGGSDGRIPRFAAPEQGAGAGAGGGA